MGLKQPPMTPKGVNETKEENVEDGGGISFDLSIGNLN